MNLAIELNEMLDRHATSICENVEREWGNKYADGNANIRQITEMLAGALQATIIASGQKAWILEYGKGSYMDLDNPFLSQYESNPNYNPDRKGHDITGRPAGTYYDLDGEPHESSGYNRGKSLEGLAKVAGLDLFAPSYPQNIIQEAIKEEIKLIRIEIIEICMLYSVEQITNAFPKEIII